MSQFIFIKLSILKIQNCIPTSRYWYVLVFVLKKKTDTGGVKINGNKTSIIQQFC